MKKLFFLVSITVLFVLVSCASSRDGWIENPYSEYQKQDYLCAVGYGKDTIDADLAAKRELASLFGMSVRSTVTSGLLETTSETNGKKTASTDQFFLVDSSISFSVDNLYGVEIVKRTSDKNNLCVSLAVLDRQETYKYYYSLLKSYRKTIDTLEESIVASFGSLKAVQDSVELVRTYGNYNTCVATCRYLSNKAIDYISLSDSMAIYRKAQNCVVLEVAVDGDDSGYVKSEVSKALTNAGFAVSNGTSEPTARVIVSISWRETAGTGLAEGFVFAEYTADISMIDVIGNETVMSFSSSAKEGHQSFESAKARAINKFVETIRNDFCSELEDKYTI